MTALTVWSFTSAARQPPAGTCVVSTDRTMVTCSHHNSFIDPLAALHRGIGSHVTRFSCRVIGRDDQGELRCAPGKPTLDYDATEVLRSFARKEALGVMHLWNAPPVVKQYLRTGDPKLRVAAETAAGSATRAAVWITAGVAAGATARVAARSAAEDAARSAAWFAAWAAARATAKDAAETAAGAAAVEAARDTAKARQSRRLARMLQAGARRER